MVVLMAETVLGTELFALIREQNLDPTQLERLSGVSRRTIYNVRDNGSAEVETLWKLAVGLATHPHTRVMNQIVYADAFTRLLRAGGFPEQIAQIVRIDLSDELEARLGDRSKAQALLRFLNQYQTMPPGQRDMFDRAVFRKEELRRDRDS